MAEGYHSFKVALIGSSSVGKTALFLRYTADEYSDQYQSTVGVDVTEKELTRGDNIIKLYLWDTAGQEKYRAITTAYFRGTDGFILVFDLTAADTLEAIEGWLKSALDGSGKDSKAVLVGNKSDMTNDRAVTKEEIQALANKLGIQYFETSVKDNVNVKEPFDALVDAMMMPPPEVESGVEEAEPEVELGAEPEVELGVELEVEPGAEPEVKPGAEPELELEAEPEIVLGVEPEIDPGAEPKVESGAEPETEKTPATGPEEGKPVDKKSPAEKPASDDEKVDLSAEQHPRPEKCGC